jgi:hypothetical protein
MIHWHRLLGVALEDYFTDSGYRVELEKELARKRQLLDIVIIQGDAGTAPLHEPPDGLEDLRPHNLMTYKSIRQSLDAWALEELVGHYVNYRKAFAPDRSVADFGLYAVSTRYPRRLFRGTAVEQVKRGVYRLPVLHRSVTVVVPRQVERHRRNAIWEMFSGSPERFVDGARDYRWHRDEAVPVVEALNQHYQQLGIVMAYSIAHFKHDYLREHLPELSPEERLAGLSAEERLRDLSPQERLRDLSPQERLRALISDDLLRELDDDAIAQLIERLQRRRSRN